MKSHSIRTDLTVPRSIEDTFALFCDAANLETLTPPELRFQIHTPLPIEMQAGARIEYQIRLYGVPFAWLTEITCWEPGVRFVDEQISGPFCVWIHEHRFESMGDSSTRIRDEVRYALPFQPLGQLAHPWIRSRLDRIFQYREQRTIELLTGQDSRIESPCSAAIEADASIAQANPNHKDPS